MTEGRAPEIGSTVTAAGVVTNYLEAGSGSPLLLLHGSGPGVTAYANWRGVIPGFADRHRVLAPDLLGFGYTSVPPGTKYVLSEWVAHLCAFLDAVGVERTHILGNSFGGALALAMATRHPHRVDNLVVMGAVSVPFELTPGLDAVWGYRPSPESMGEALEYFVHDHRFITPDLVESRYTASIRPTVQERYAALFPPPRQQHIHDLCCGVEDLRRIAAPTLIVHGRDDRVIPVEVSIRLHHLLERSELHVFGQCGHWTQIEKRDRFVQLVSGFLADRSASDLDAVLPPGAVRRG